MEKEAVSSRHPAEVLEAIDTHRPNIEETRGGYLSLIAQWWVAQGCPPVSDYEKKIREKQASNKHTARRAS